MANVPNQKLLGETWQDASRCQQQAIEQIQTQIQELTRLVGQLRPNAGPHNLILNQNVRRPKGVLESDSESEFQEIALNQERGIPRQDERFPREGNRRWESWDLGIKVNIGEFEGHLQPEEFLDWVDRID